MDFTISKYQDLLVALGKHKNHRLRHDVDLRPEYALRIAKVEAAMGHVATYYFRVMHFKSHESVIKEISRLGHQIGYHYECLTTTNGVIDKAYDDFRSNLELLRQIALVTTACAHGSPRSPWNSQDIWSHYDIHALGIEYEPMLDTDFSQTLYLTDTGRRWDGYKVSVRDKVPQYQNRWIHEGLVFHSTDDITNALNDMNHQIHKYNLLVNTHPQRWMPFGIGWLKEASMQSAKNIIKGLIVSTR